MRGKILATIVIVIIAFFAYQIFAHPANFEKANAEFVPAYAVQIPEIPNESIDNYSNNFETALALCRRVGSYQKNYVQVSNPRAAVLSAALVMDSKTELEKAKAVFDYVSGEIKYKLYDNWRTTGEVLETKEGDCTDKSILLVSMLKNAGIESYVVYGKKIEDYSHSWVSAKIEGKWIQMDATTTGFYYFYECMQDSNCENAKYYSPIGGIFDENSVLKCA